MLRRCALAATCVALLGCSTPTTEAQMVHGSRLPSWKPTYAMPASTFMMVRPRAAALPVAVWCCPSGPPAGPLLTRRRRRLAGLQQHGAVQHRVRLEVGHRGLCATHCPLPPPLWPSCFRRPIDRLLTERSAVDWSNWIRGTNVTWQGQHYGGYGEQVPETCQENLRVQAALTKEASENRTKVFVYSARGGSFSLLLVRTCPQWSLCWGQGTWSKRCPGTSPCARSWWTPPIPCVAPTFLPCSTCDPGPRRA